LINAQFDDANIETPEQRFDADYAIMTLELAALIKRMFDIFGGEDEAAYAKMK
jgi:recombination associated protein RdgC